MLSLVNSNGPSKKSKQEQPPEEKQVEMVNRGIPLHFKMKTIMFLKNVVLYSKLVLNLEFYEHSLPAY